MNVPRNLADIIPLLIEQLATARRALLCAPPGCGKSTAVPCVLAEAFPGIIIVLQPRRIAARSLAAYTSFLHDESAPGSYTGYRVKGDVCVGPGCRVIYETYGVFLRRALQDPLLTRDAVVVLDEFHERNLDMDLALAWLTHRHQCSSDAPPFLVMSATLETDTLCTFLGIQAPLIVLPPVHPVVITHVTPEPGESPQRSAARAIRPLLSNTGDGSILVFMPGKGEILSTVDAIAELDRSVPVYALHGSLSLAEQTAVIAAPSRKFCVIVSTNVAETSLTIPGIRTVIDSGLERRASFDAARDRNTLSRMRICFSSAVQRAGRAGREGPGRCIRLYAKTAEDGMQRSLSPEIGRLELTGLVLQVLGLLERSSGVAEYPQLLPWLTEPDAVRLDHALAELAAIGALAAGKASPTLSDRGRALLDWPLDPRPAAFIYEGMAIGLPRVFCALAAIMEQGRSDNARDLLDGAFELSANARSGSFDHDTRESFRELERIALSRSFAPVLNCSEAEARLHAKACLLRLLPRRLAARGEGRSYAVADGSSATLAGNDTRMVLPDVIIAIEFLHMAGGDRARRTVITGYAALDIEWLQNELAAECIWEKTTRWDEKRSAAVAEEHLLCRGIVLVRRPLSNRQAAGADAAALLVDRCASGEIDLVDETVQTLLARIALIARACPHYGLHVPDADDWQLIYEELCAGARSAAELSPGKLSREIVKYMGGHVQDLLDRLTPLRVTLVSGKPAKIAYPTDGDPLLSARIGDLAGSTTPIAVCEGRVGLVYDILAPNYRTVQKTRDIGGFWTGIYPRIRTELKRRYPRHIWP